MTWSLKLSGGDLKRGKGNSLATVTGANKVQQDLFHWIMTELGRDPFNLSYGSVLSFEPGETISINGEEIVYVSEDKVDLVVSEINRIIEEYQKKQLARLREEIILYEGRHTFSEGEIIEDFFVEYEFLFDTLYVDIRLVMLNGIEQSIEIKI
jgi:translation initiation factor 2 beta subunit (eIF-2beta)/eIF-5